MAAIARRKDKDWYLGVLRSGATQEMIIDCSFLGDGEYTAEIFIDDTEAERIDLKGLNKETDLRQWDTAVPFKKRTETVSKDNTIIIQLAEHGGATIKFIKK
ncbi:glycoside hydrolase family 97 C-terminal domain-containing protein [Zobellia nedashkovskayae]